MPYCHKPCYGLLFGPQMLGFGSNVASPANFRKPSETSNGVQGTSFDENPDGLKLIYKTTNTSPGPLKLTRNVRDNEESPESSFPKRHSAGYLTALSDSSGYSSNDGSTELKLVSESSEDSGLKCIYQSNPLHKTVSVTRSNSDVGKFVAQHHRSTKVRGAELFKRVQSYNEQHDKKGQKLSLLEEDGNVRVSGPLRIYWGLQKPIILQHSDHVPPVLIPKRYSIVSDGHDLQPLPEATHNNHEEGLHLGHRGLDDSVILSPSSDSVVRRTNIRKSNTVAYRGDRPNKWKRASINGHIYNYDTNVFTPVLGSCTSVTVDNKMSVSQVIKTLLDKFKVENQADEYKLCIITEQEGERELRETDIPLLERLMLGPSDSVKIFIRDNEDSRLKDSPAYIPDTSSPTTESPPDEGIPLPEEVEQLVSIPEPVLQGLLEKFRKDEEIEVRRLKAKYERIRKRVKQIIEEKKRTSSRC